MREASVGKNLASTGRLPMLAELVRAEAARSILPLMQRAAFRVLVFAWMSAFLAAPARAEEVFFPPDAGVVDVTKAPYFAKGDGRTDDTEAIQQALLDHPNGNRIVYLPNGTYRVAATLRWPNHPNLEAQWRSTILQGQSRDGVVVRLMDYAPGFNNSGRGRPILWTGEKGHVRARNAVRNLTVDSGVGNPGAIGIQFMANKQGCIRDVRIVSGSPKQEGIAGLDLTHTEENGPFLVANLVVEGFDYGVRASYPMYGAVFEHLVLTGQRECGLRNSSQTVSIRDLRSTNRVVAIENTDAAGFITLVEAHLEGTATNRIPPAIRNKGVLFARQLKTPGYRLAVENRAGHEGNATGPEVREFVSHPIFNAFPAPQYSINLPVRETPMIAPDPPDQWVSPAGFGGTPDDLGDDSKAIQAAIDSGKSTLYLPPGTWRIRQPVEVRGNIRRIIGCEARLAIDDMRTIPALSITNGTSEMVVIERLEVEPGSAWLLNRAVRRTLVLRDCYNVRASFDAPGDLYLDDVSSVAAWRFKDMDVWARQFTVEPETTKITVEGGSFWGLGLKGDRQGTFVHVLGGAKAEVLGGLCVANGPWKEAPMFRVEDASASFVMAEASFARAPFQVIVQERRGDVTRSMSNQGFGDDKLPFRVGGIALPLFTAYLGATGNVPPRASAAGRTNNPARPF